MLNPTAKALQGGPSSWVALPREADDLRARHCVSEGDGRGPEPLWRSEGASRRRPTRRRSRHAALPGAGGRRRDRLPARRQRDARSSSPLGPPVPRRSRISGIPLTQKLPALEPRASRLCRSSRTQPRSTIIRGNLFNRLDMRLLPPSLPGDDNDLSDRLAHYRRPGRARSPTRVVYAFGERWGPEPGNPDKIFHFEPGNGIHDIHMNQGNDPGHSRRRRRMAGWRADPALPGDRPMGRHLPRLPVPGLAHGRRRPATPCPGRPRAQDRRRIRASPTSGCGSWPPWSIRSGRRPRPRPSRCSTRRRMRSILPAGS